MSGVYRHIPPLTCPHVQVLRESSAPRRATRDNSREASRGPTSHRGVAFLQPYLLIVVLENTVLLPIRSVLKRRAFMSDSKGAAAGDQLWLWGGSSVQAPSHILCRAYLDTGPTAESTLSPLFCLRKAACICTVTSFSSERKALVLP